MAISAKLSADFSSFVDAAHKAEVSLRSFESGAQKVEAGLSRMANSFSGVKIIQDAQLATEAVKRIGGATSLTEKEQARLNATVTEAIAKYTALGHEAPADMIALADATKRANTETDKMPGKMNSVTSSMRSFDGALAGVGLSIGPQVAAIEDISNAAGKSAKDLGVLTTAGLAFGAAAAGWKVGRLVADFFDLDQKIGAATARLLGYGDVAAQVGGAKQDSINLAIKRGADAMIGYTEAIKFNAEWSARFNAGGAQVAESVKKTTEAASAAWVKNQAELARAAEAHAKLQKEMMAFHLFLDQKMIPSVDAFAFNIEMVAPKVEQLGIAVTNGLPKDTFEILGDSIKMVPPQIDKTKNSLDALVGSLAQLGQIGGSAFSGVVQGVGSILGGVSSGGKGLDAFKAVGGSMTSHIAGLATMATGYGAVAMAAIAAGKAIFKAMNDGRKAVEDFAKSSGGFDALHASMSILGDEGERLWIKLTQGTKKGDQKGAQAVIDEITAALERQRAKTAEVDAATQAAAEKQAAAIEAISGKYTEQLSKLDSEYKTLSDSVGQEADELEMGVQETRDRARMAQIEIEKAAVEEKKKNEIAASTESYDAQVEAAKDADGKIREIFGKPIRVPIIFDYPGGGTASAPPTSGTGTYSGASSAMRAGSRAGGASSAVIQVTAVTNIDGREAARSIAPHIPAFVFANGH